MLSSIKNKAPKYILNLGISLFLFVSLVLTGCKKHGRDFSVKLVSDDTVCIVGENVVLKVPKNGSFRVSDPLLKSQDNIFRFQQEGMTVAIFNNNPYVNRFIFKKKIDAKKYVKDIFEGPDFDNGVISYANDSLRVEIPYDSVIKRNTDVCIRGWGPSLGVSGNMPVLGQYLVEESGMDYLRSFYVSLAEKDARTNGYVPCSLRKNTPIKMAFKITPEMTPDYWNEFKYPMWHFDETNCRWTIDAYAQLDGDSCVCTVNKLGLWACYKSEKKIRQITLFVVDEDMKPIHNAVIDVITTAAISPKHEKYTTAADGSCVFYVPVEDGIIVKYMGLCLSKIQQKPPFECEYINLPNDSLLFELNRGAENYGRQVVIAIDQKRLHKKYNVLAGVEDFMPSDFEYFCPNKLRSSGMGMKVGRSTKPKVSYYLYYQNSKNRREKVMLYPTLGQIKSKIDLDYPVKIEAIVDKTQQVLNIQKVKDEYSRNAMIDIENDYINPMMLDGGRLSFEFAGSDACYNSTIDIPSVTNFYTRGTSKAQVALIGLGVALLVVGVIYKFISYKKKSNLNLYRIIAAVLKLGPNYKRKRGHYKRKRGPFVLTDRQWDILVDYNDLFFLGLDIKKISELVEHDETELLACIPNVVKNSDMDVRRSLVQMLFKLAAQDDGIKDDEWLLILRIMYALKLHKNIIAYFQRNYEGLRTHQEESETENDNKKNEGQTDNSHVSNAYADDYAVLGLPNGASVAQVKQAYHQLALKHHPDLPKNARRYGQCVMKMAAINLAYSRLMKMLQ